MEIWKPDSMHVYSEINQKVCTFSKHPPNQISQTTFLNKTIKKLNCKFCIYTTFHFWATDVLNKIIQQENLSEYRDKREPTAMVSLPQLSKQFTPIPINLK